jgi:hypothetical protein
VSRRGAGLHVAVNDGDPGLPVLAAAASRGAGEPRDDSHGLRAVHAAAVVWGAMPTSAGKVVWALVRPDRP